MQPFCLSNLLLLVLHFQTLFEFLILFLFKTVVGISHGFFLLLTPLIFGYAGSHVHLQSLGLLAFIELLLGCRKTKKSDYATYLWGLGIGLVEVVADFQATLKRFNDHLLVLSLEAFDLFLCLQLLLLFRYLVKQLDFVIRVLLNLVVVLILVMLIMLVILVGPVELVILAKLPLIKAKQVKEDLFKQYFQIYWLIKLVAKEF
jgi:hypothetical protein